MPEKTILRLTDAFDKSLDPDIEVKVTMLNINFVHNRELMDACKPLYEFSWFINRIRAEHPSKDTLGDAVDAAIADMPVDFMIRDFLVKNQEEVKTMCITEYNQEEVMDIRYEEGREEGILEMLIGLVKDSILTIADAAKRANMTVSEFEAKTGLKA